MSSENIFEDKTRLNRAWRFKLQEISRINSNFANPKTFRAKTRRKSKPRVEKV